MTSRAFFFQTLAWIGVLCGVTIFINVRLNFYGLFGDARGKTIKIYYNERLTKLLLSSNYVPANFESIVVGSSISNNLDVGKYPDLKIYNASVDGGNISEVSILARNIIRGGNMKAMFLLLDPYMFKNHGVKSVAMRPDNYWTALGSWNLLKAYRTKYAMESSGQANQFDEFGFSNFTRFAKVSAREAIREASARPSEPFALDPEALSELSALVAEAHSRGVIIIAFYPPTPQELLERKQVVLKDFDRKVAPLWNTHDRLVDFNSPEFADFRNHVDNFHDSVHLSAQGAEVVLKRLVETYVQSASQLKN